jgi:hypothetical protein
MDDVCAVWSIIFCAGGVSGVPYVYKPRPVLSLSTGNIWSDPRSVVPANVSTRPSSSVGTSRSPYCPPQRDPAGGGSPCRGK